MVRMKPSLFMDVKYHILVVIYWQFGTYFQPHIQESTSAQMVGNWLIPYYKKGVVGRDYFWGR